jgi:dihydrodipicolinate synthase/N-acetylneuraminate lyase
VLNGNDRQFSLAMNSSAGGCITALANLYSPELRIGWDEYLKTGSVGQIQGRLDSLRTVLENYSPYPPVLKAMLSRLHGFPTWSVCPPLVPVSDAVSAQAAKEFSMAVPNVIL